MIAVIRIALLVAGITRTSRADEDLVADRRDGALKMGWTKPPEDARPYGD